MLKTLTVALAITLAAASMALAAGEPAEVKLVDGAFTDQSGKPLYVFSMDTMKNMSHCEAACATAWPPLLAGKAAKPSGDWYLVGRADGSKQWAYKDHPLYTFAKDAPGAAPTGASDLWLLAKP